MKQRNRRVVAAFLAATMVTLSLVGCGQSAEVGMESNDKQGVDSGSDVKQDEVTELKTIRIFSFDNSATDSSGKMVYLSDWIDGDSKMWEQLSSDLAERGLKLELDLIPQDQFATVVKTQVVSGFEDYDMVYFGPNNDKMLMDLAERGAIVPVNEIWENYSDGTAKEFCTSGFGGKIYSKQRSEDGNNYWLCGLGNAFYGDRTIGMYKGLCIRQDWLDKLDIETPKTSEDVYNVLVAFREQDANGNGQADELAGGDFKNFENGFAQMFGLYPSVVCFDSEKKQMNSVFYQEGIKDYFSYMNKLYKADLLDLSGQSSRNLAENKYGLYFNWWSATWDEPTIVVPEGEAAPQYAGIICAADNVERPVLIDNAGETGYANSVITATADKEAMGILLDYLVSDEYINLTENGIEGYTYDVIDGMIVKRRESDISEVQIMSKLPALWQQTLPRIEMKDMEVTVNTCQENGKSAGYPETGYEAKAEVLREAYDNYDDYTHYYYDPSLVMATGTQEEIMRINEIYVDFQTYYQELALKLIMGELSLDNWDTYIANLQELGLDEIIDIYQARYERTQ